MLRPKPQHTHQSNSLLRFNLRSFILLLTLSSFTSSLTAQSGEDLPQLKLGTPIQRELSGGGAHSYRVELNSGQFIHAVVDQRGIDVVASLFAPDGKKVVEVDSPNGVQGPEPVLFIADTTGTYRLEVRSLEEKAPVGRYEVKVKELRAATGDDKKLVAAQMAFNEAEQLRSQATAQSLRSAINKYEEFLWFERVTGDRNGEATTLNFIGSVYSTLDDKQKALEYYNEALPLHRANGNKFEEATALQHIGSIYSRLGEKQKALNYLKQSLPLYHAIGAADGEAVSLHNMGGIYVDLGQLQKALESFNQSLSLQKAMGGGQGGSATLNGIGTVYNAMGDNPKAIEYYNQALLQRRAANNGRGVAETLNNLGVAFFALGDRKKTLELYEEALPIWRALRHREGEATTLNGIGGVYRDLGEKAKALEYYNQALLLFKDIKDQKGEAVTLGNIGGIYADLGEAVTAIDYYNKVLPVRRAIGDRDGEALTLNSIGIAYNALGDKVKALGYFNASLTLLRAVGDRLGEVAVLNNIGKAHFDLKERVKAFKHYNYSLDLAREVGDRDGVATALNNIAQVFELSGEYRQALEYYYQALPIWRGIGDRGGEAGTLNNLSNLYMRVGNERLGAAIGKLSVNRYQELRSYIQALDKTARQAYLRSIESTYRRLAGILLREKRYDEALQVLNAFKDQQLFDFDVKGKAPSQLTLTKREQDFGARYTRFADQVNDTSIQLTALTRNKTPNIDSERATQLKKYEAESLRAKQEYSAFIKTVESEFSQPSSSLDEVLGIRDRADMQAVLKQLSAETSDKTVAVYTLVGESEFHGLIITEDGITAASTPIKGAELNNVARQLWALLQSPNYDPTKLSYKFYKSIFEPIETLLPKDTKTIMWSLDGNLRYLPPAALYDGKQFLVERFNHEIFTRADEEGLTRPVSPIWNGYGFAASTAHTVEVDGRTLAFGSLDFVKDEMQVFRTRTYSDGIIDGDIFAETDFTKASLLATLKQSRPVVHISSHFRFSPGDESRSFLLLGDGQVMTLAEMSDQANLFRGVQLLTLSACDTAAQRPDSNGREVDAFAELAQRLGAGAVMASLWSVTDKSTALLMKGFYRNREGGKHNKAEALRKAQLELIHWNVEGPTDLTKQGSATTRRRGSADIDLIVDAKYRVPFMPDREKPYAHPYYWSPFVLFGNWK